MDPLTATLVDFFAFEQARIRRRTLAIRFGVAMFIVAILGFVLHWLPPSIAWVCVAACAVAPLWARLVEQRCKARLTRRMT